MSVGVHWLIVEFTIGSVSFFFFSSRRRHTRFDCDWSSDVCSSDLAAFPGTSPGFGKAAAADGSRYPYIFPIAATYWSQATAAVKFVKDQLGGSLKGKKIGFLFYDNPAGREPIPILEDLSVKEGFQLKTFAVPPPGVEMGGGTAKRSEEHTSELQSQSNLVCRLL